MSNLLLETIDLAIGYGPKRSAPKVIAQELNLHLHAGELVCLLGPNGAGKSTLLRTLAGMQPSLEGSIFINGRPLADIPPQALAQQLSIVLTEPVDPGLLSAYALVALGRYPYTDWRGVLTRQDELVVQKAIQAVGGIELAPRPVGELSDGERQKIMIARALAQEPKIMILDEPTAFLDLPRRVEIMRILRRLARGGQQAFLLSTHDLDLALRTADKIWLMADKRLLVGTPEDLVLSGDFARAFVAAGVTFDAQRGAFELHQPVGETIGVVGEGLKLTWTIRALERAGYHPVAEPQALTIKVNCGQLGWELHHQGQVRPIPSIEALLEVLKQPDW